MANRTAIIDSLLVILASAIIVVSFLPEPTKLRVVHARLADGTLQVYRLPLDDPQLGQLKRRLAASPARRGQTALAVAKWTQEIAQFYAARCGQSSGAATKTPADSPIMAVSFQQSTAEGAKPRPDAATPEYWLGVSGQMQTRIDAIQQRLTRFEKSPPIVLGETVPGKHPISVYTLALAGGVLVAGLFAIWRRIAPPLQVACGNDNTLALKFMIAEEESAVKLEASSSGVGRIEIPNSWLRIRQPLSVVIQRLSVLVLVAFAVFRSFC